MAYPNWVFSTFAFLGFLGVTIPLPWHLEAWNTGTCLYMIWASIACLNQFINSVVWTGNAINWAPVWCDISTRLMIGTNYAIPAASLCINRRLYHIASVTTVTVTKAEKRRAVMADMAIGLGIPVLGMVLQYIDQGHRFNIFEDVGCYPFTYNTWVGYLLVSTPPLAIGLVSGVYCVLSIRAFNKRRAQFKELLSANSNLTHSRYFRLMCLAGTELLFTTPMCIYGIVLNTQAGVNPYISWANVHSGFHRVDQFPSLIWRSNAVGERSIELSRWSIIICAFIFFGYFGFADEARKHYKLAFESVAKRVGLSTGSMSSTGISSSNGKFSNSSNGNGRNFPVFIRQETKSKRDSFDSFSDMSIMDAGGALQQQMTEEKPARPSLTISLKDVGGLLQNPKAVYTPTSPSTCSSSTLPPSPSHNDVLEVPRATVHRERDIEISSARSASSTSSFYAPTPRSFDSSSAPSHVADAPKPVRPEDIV